MSGAEICAQPPRFILHLTMETLDYLVDAVGLALVVALVVLAG